MKEKLEKAAWGFSEYLLGRLLFLKGCIAGAEGAGSGCFLGGKGLCCLFVFKQRKKQLSGSSMYLIG